MAAGNRDMEAEQSHTDKGIPRSYENIILCHLNVCCWTKSNEQLRIGITNEINPDMFSLNETHLGESQLINVEGYSWKGFNRTCVHKDAPKAFRLVGFLIKDKSLQEYSFEITDKSLDGILCIKLTSKSTDYGCYFLHVIYRRKILFGEETYSNSFRMYYHISI